MGFSSHHDEPPTNPTKRCNYLASNLKDAFANCKSCRGCISPSSTPEEDESKSEIDYDDDDGQEVVSEIRTRAMEAKSRREDSMSFFWVLPLEVSVPKEEEEEFFSVASYFSRHSSRDDQYVSVKSNFSSGRQFRPQLVQEYLRHGLDSYYFQDLRRRSMIQELWRCEGWPFGLCRKTLLLPPLPKSPSESWKWRSKSARMGKQHWQRHYCTK